MADGLMADFLGKLFLYKEAEGNVTTEWQENQTC
jgi:hypothetical protein